MRQLSGMDTAMLYGETPTWHMHTGALLVLDPSTAPEPFTAERFRHLLRSRLSLLGPFRTRVVFPPLGMGRPFWVDDADLDLDHHVRRVAVPAPGGPHEVSELVGHLLGIQIDRTRPLWECWFLEGLDGGRVGLLVKTHHAGFDGVRAARLFEAIYDLTPDAPIDRPGVDDAHQEPDPSFTAMAAANARLALSAPIRATRTALRLAKATGRVLGMARTPEWSSTTLPFQAPRTALNRRLTADRGFAYCSLSLPAVKTVTRAFDVTVNDVVLAVCTEVLRRWLADHGGVPDRPLVAQVPVAVHVRDDAGAGVQGNFVSAMGATLPTHLADPVERLMAVRDSTDASKHLHRALGDDIILDLVDLAPPRLVGAGARLFDTLHLGEVAPPIFSAIVSNVRGAPMPLFAAGARLIATYPVGPLLVGAGLNITVLSYADALDVGFATCPDVVADPWQLADVAPDALAELVTLAERPPG